MNVISYNLKRHIELLNHQKKVISQNKSFFKENQAEFLELSHYNADVAQHIFWEDRFEVASLIQTFLNKEINAEEFHDSVFGLRRNHIDKCDKFLSKLVSGEIKEFFPTLCIIPNSIGISMASPSLPSLDLLELNLTVAGKLK